MTRALKDGERKAVMLLSNEVGSVEDRQQLLADLEVSLVHEAVADGSLLKFEIHGYQRPPYRGQHEFRGKDGFPVEGAMKDADGSEINVWLFADENNRILELELNKFSPDDVILADWSTFKVR